MLALLLLACTGLQLGAQVGERCDTPCAVTLQHPLLPEGQHFASFTLQGGDLVTVHEAKVGSVTVLHPKGKQGQALAERILRGETPGAMAEAWVLQMDAQGVVHEHGTRPAGITELKLSP